VLPTKVYEFTPKHDTYIGNFLFGILTAVLSTPCTFGMFLGLLVWATYQPPVLGTSLVMTVGLGRAAPYQARPSSPAMCRAPAADTWPTPAGQGTCQRCKAWKAPPSGCRTESCRCTCRAWG